ncbi:UvrD-helicase domain-containing protein [Amycolatopsis sp. cmx-11-51]|uniref:UvrD-helicase domain-containing protein n=1 Tax=unclassified Amycolatopsis TaxID=2618356 RepID=UPI0039E4CB04
MICVVLCWSALDIERNRQQRGQLHYDDLLRHAQRLLRIKPIAHLYRQHYGTLLVDEFQDFVPTTTRYRAAHGGAPPNVCR